MPDIQITAPDGGSFSAYIAKPAALPAPVLIVIQEIFGVNAEMRARCDALAREGFIAVCPDLFWRQEPGIQLTDKTEAEWKRAFELYNGFNVGLGVEDLLATLGVCRTLPGTNGKAGCIGFCLGGKLAYLMAARTDVDGAISYYGVGIEALLDEAEDIKTPLLMHIAEEDKFSSKDAQAKIREGLKEFPQIAIYSYPGVNHAFARPGGEHYDEKATALAGERSLEFLRETLRLPIN